MTAGPGTVKAVYDIDLPRPRGAVQEIRFEPRFLELHHQIWESLREEVERAYARTAPPTLDTRPPRAARPLRAARWRTARGNGHEPRPGTAMMSGASTRAIPALDETTVASTARHQRAAAGCSCTRRGSRRWWW